MELQTKIIEQAKHLARLGWQVLPVLGKVPQGTAWQEKATNNTDQIDGLFTSHAFDGVGVRLGQSSGVVDIECDNEQAEHTLFELLGGEMPLTPTFASARGKHYLFRWQDGLPEIAVFKVNGLEFRVGNKAAAQSVLPPSPGRSWEIGPETPLAEFPAWGEVLRRFSESRKPKPIKTNTPYNGTSYDSNEKLNVPRWLAKHGIEIYDVSQTQDGATRWLIPCPNMHTHTGKNNVRDCCVTQEQDGTLGGCCFHQSCGMDNWDSLRDAIGPLEFSDYAKPEQENQTPVDLSQFGTVQPEIVQPVKAERIIDSLSLMRSSEFPQELLEVPGLIKEFVDYCRATAPRFLPESAFANAVAIVSAITGRKIKSRTGMRTNIYMVMLAPSRSGKDWSRQRTRECFDKAGMLDMLGAEKFASEAGLISQVQANPTILFQLDEVNRYFATINAAGAKSSHLFGIFSTLMELHGQAGNATWTPKGYGDSKNNKTISYPHCALYCTGVPDGFWAALKSSDATDGFLGRMMVIETTKMPRSRETELFDPPETIIDIMRQWQAFQADGGNLKSVNPVATFMPFDSAATDRLRKHREDIEDRIPTDSHNGQAIWAQTSANATKLSMIFAASRGTQELIVTKQDAEYAIKLANWCTKLLIERIYSHVSETPAEAKRKRVLDIIRKHGEIDRNALTRKTFFLNDARERHNILKDLLDAELIESAVVATTGRAREVFKCLI